MCQTAIVCKLRQTAVFFQPLQYAGNAYLNKLIQVAAGDSEKLYAFQQRVAGVVGLFQDAAVKKQPALIAVDVACIRSEAVLNMSLPGNGLAAASFRSGLPARALACFTLLLFRRHTDWLNDKSTQLNRM